MANHRRRNDAGNMASRERDERERPEWSRQKVNECAWTIFFGEVRIQEFLQHPTCPAHFSQLLKLTTPTYGDSDESHVHDQQLNHFPLQTWVLGAKYHILTWPGRSALSVDDERELKVSDGRQANHRGCEPYASRKSVVLLGLVQTSRGSQHVQGFGR